MNRDEILTILSDWNYWGNYQDNSIERNSYVRKLQTLLKANETIIIKGVRRAGKSTLILNFLRKIIENGVDPKNTLVVNFEDPRFLDLNLDILNQIYDLYLEEMNPDKHHYVVLDEVQEVNGWEKFVRFLRESKKANVFVTGSSSKLLSEEYSTLLSGRHVDLEVFPLSFEEFLRFKNMRINNRLDLINLRYKIKNKLKEFMEFGGFPKVTLVGKEEKKLILRSYFDDILIKDVQRRFNIREVEKLESMAKYYLSNISSLQSFNKIKNIANLSLDTVERFSKYLSIGRLFFFVPKFSFSYKTQILNPKKVYCIDTGLRNVMGFRFSEDVGKLMENTIFLDLIKKSYEIYYWKDHTGKEVDFVLKENKRIKELIQVTYASKTDEIRKGEIDALLKASKELKCKNLTMITWDYDSEEVVKSRKIIFKPIWKYLLGF